jgi:hypothetical protein
MRLTRNALNTAGCLVVILALSVLAFSVSATASAVSEQQKGAQVVSEVGAGQLDRANLTGTQYRQVGQYLMGRALGSTPRYEAMDSLMDRMMGQAVSDQMYLYMGERYLGRPVPPNGGYGSYYGWMAKMMSRYGGGPYAGMMGSYMMGAYRSLSPGGSAPYAGMMGGSYPASPSMMRNAYGTHGTGSGGWPTAAIVAIAVLVALSAVGVLAYLRSRPRGGQRRSNTPATGHR